MPLFSFRSADLGRICVRRWSLANVHLTQLQLMPNQTVARNMNRMLLQSKCQPCSPNSPFNRTRLLLNRFSANDIGPSSNRFHFYYRLLMSSSIKERIFDSLILFTRMLNKQSNVYMCLHLRRLGQICTLYRRIYSARDFKNLFIDQLLDRLRHFALLFRRPSSHLQGILLRHRVLLSFASLGLFNWEENRITDQELQELMREFIFIESSKLSGGEEQNESYCRPDCTASEPSTANVAEESSFMVVSCLQATKKSADNWEEVINQPNFHVWRKSVNNTSLYEYKVFGSFFDISAYAFYSVQRDLEFRKQWDKLVLKLDIVDIEPESMIPQKDCNIDDSGNELVHWIMKYPYPMKSREYLFIRRSRVDYERQFIVTVSRSVPYPDIPESDEHVRVYDYMSQMVIRPHNDNFHEYGFDYMLTYFDDPRASFPSPAYNWMASRGVPDFVEKLHQAALRLSLGKSKDFPAPETRSIEVENVGEVDAKDDNYTTQASSDSKTATHSVTCLPANSSSSSSSSSSLPSDVEPIKAQTLASPSLSGGVNIASSSDRNWKGGKSVDSTTNGSNSFSFKSLNIWS